MTQRHPAFSRGDEEYGGSRISTLSHLSTLSLGSHVCLAALATGHCGADKTSRLLSLVSCGREQCSLSFGRNYLTRPSAINPVAWAKGPSAVPSTCALNIRPISSRTPHITPLWSTPRTALLSRKQTTLSGLPCLLLLHGL